MIIVRNWREQNPYVGHISALIWSLYRQAAGAENANPPELAQLRVMNGFVKHGLQGRRHSDHHHHTNIEQMYYILQGRGEVLIGQEKRAVQEGDAVYFPVNVPHQAFNDGDEWMEHLIVSCPLQDIRQGTPAVRNWREATPRIGEHGAVVWSLLTRQDAATPAQGGVLQRMHAVTRQALQGRQSTTVYAVEGVEQVYYVLSGTGSVASGETEAALVEGSAVYVPPGVPHRFVNKGDGWLEYVVFAAAVDGAS